MLILANHIYIFFFFNFSSGDVASPGGVSPIEAKPVERQVEARPVDDSLGSMVRCLYFARTFLVNGKFYNTDLLYCVVLHSWFSYYTLILLYLLILKTKYMEAG